MAKILIVEDNPSVAKLIEATLSIASYDTKIVSDGSGAVELIVNEDWDMILLDVMLPGLDGFEVLEKIKFRNIPIIFITARDAVQDRVKGLKMGAEDYILKPFEPVELLARVEVVLRRYNRLNKNLVFENVEVDLEQYIVTKDGVAIDLTPKEFDLLVLFIRNAGIALSREKILGTVWGYDFEGESRSIDIHVQKLRKKLGWNDRIKTVFKVGYRLEK